MSDEQNSNSIGIYTKVERLLKRAWHQLNDTINPLANKRRRIAANDIDIGPLTSIPHNEQQPSSTNLPSVTFSGISIPGDILLTRVFPFVGIEQFLFVAGVDTGFKELYTEYLAKNQAGKHTVIDVGAFDSDKTIIVKQKARIDYLEESLKDLEAKKSSELAEAKLKAAGEASAL